MGNRQLTFIQSIKHLIQQHDTLYLNQYSSFIENMWTGTDQNSLCQDDMHSNTGLVELYPDHESSNVSIHQLSDFEMGDQHIDSKDENKLNDSDEDEDDDNDNNDNEEQQHPEYSSRDYKSTKTVL